MKKFLVLYMAPLAEMDKMMASSTPEGMKEGMNKWMVWMETHKEMFSDKGGPASRNMRVMPSGSSMTRNEVTGYSVLQAASHDEAAKIFSDCPHFDIPGAYVDLTELMDMSGM
jgi:hypothetical protein